MCMQGPFSKPFLRTPSHCPTIVWKPPQLSIRFELQLLFWNTRYLFCQKESALSLVWFANRIARKTSYGDHWSTFERVGSPQQHSLQLPSFPTHLERMCEEVSSAEQWCMCKVWEEEINPRMVTEVVRMVRTLTIVWFVAQCGSRSVCPSMQWSKKTCIYPKIILGKTKCNIANLPNGTMVVCGTPLHGYWVRAHCVLLSLFLCE